jgi:hypothetical protein
MTAAVIALAEQADDCEALRPVLAELHGLIAIDPILGASPVRILFVLNREARAHVAACIDPADAHSRLGPAYVLVAYDFPFALHQFTASRDYLPEDRAKAIITCSAALQSDAFQRAAGAFGLAVRAIPSFDAAALKAAFFPTTQATVTHLFRLWPASARGEANTWS